MLMFRQKSSHIHRFFGISNKLFPWREFYLLARSFQDKYVVVLADDHSHVVKITPLKTFGHSIDGFAHCSTADVLENQIAGLQLLGKNYSRKEQQYQFFHFNYFYKSDLYILSKSNGSTALSTEKSPIFVRRKAVKCAPDFKAFPKS